MDEWEIALQAKNILLIGHNLNYITKNFESFFRNFLFKKNGILRLLIINRENKELLKTISHGVMESSSTEPDFNSFYDIITNFRKELPDDQKYRINLRTINYVPTLSFQIIDGDQPNGTILVELTPNKIKVSERPHFILHANNDAHKIWYQKFLNNCEEMFKSEEERINNRDMSETNKDKMAIPWKWPEY